MSFSSLSKCCLRILALSWQAESILVKIWVYSLAESANYLAVAVAIVDKRAADSSLGDITFHSFASCHVDRAYLHVQRYVRQFIRVNIAWYRQNVHGMHYLNQSPGFCRVDCKSLHCPFRPSDVLSYWPAFNRTFQRIEHFIDTAQNIFLHDRYS